MDSKEHFKTQCISFYDSIEKKLKEEAERFEKTIDSYRNEMVTLHTRINESYKNLFQFMLNNAYDDDKKNLLEAMEILMTNLDYAEEFAIVINEAYCIIKEGKRPTVVHDKAQYVYGTKPLYFDFDED